VLARRYGLNPKTVAKWRKRDGTDDMPIGPKPARHRKLTAEEEGTIVRFRAHTLLPLDDCLYALQARIPHLSRSSLHRCLQRHGVSRLAETVEVGDAAENGGTQPPGCLYIDTSEVRSTEGTHYLFNAIDQASKFVCVGMANHGDAGDAVAFIAALAAGLPFRIDRVVTLAVVPFTSGSGESAFTRACTERGIEHRLTDSPDPWSHGRVARMERALRQEVTFASAAYLANLLRDFVQAYNFRRRLKFLRGRTPHDFVCDAWQREPWRFLRDPHHEFVGLEIVPDSPPGGL
jgi:transposase InsO family protein